MASLRRAQAPRGHLASRLHGNGRPLDLPNSQSGPKAARHDPLFMQGPVQAVPLLQVRLPSFQPHWTSAPIPRSSRPALRRGRVCGGNGWSMREDLGAGISILRMGREKEFVSPIARDGVVCGLTVFRQKGQIAAFYLGWRHLPYAG